MSFISQLSTTIMISYTMNLYDDQKLTFLYVFVSFSLIICTQSIAEIGTIIYPDNVKLSLLFSMLIFVCLIIFSNTLVPLKEVSLSVKWISWLSFVRYGSELLLIYIYGFNRCKTGYISGVLFSHSLDSHDFWPNLFKLMIIHILLKLLTLIILIIKSNNIFDHWLRLSRSKIEDEQCPNKIRNQIV